MKWNSWTLAALVIAAPAPAAAFDHSHAGLDQVLRAHVKAGRVDYGALAQDRAPLDRYVAALSAVTSAEERAFSSQQAFAFWINAYNALTLKLIIDEKPKKSIRDLGDPWKTFTFQVAGRTVTLDQLEHQIIRARWKDPRVHAVLVCAAVSCPILESRAFGAKTLDGRLEAAARRWARDTTKNDFKDGTLHVSRIFEWFGQDFVARFAPGKTPADAVRGFFSHYLDRAIPPATPIQYLPYDWTLNGTW